MAPPSPPTNEGVHPERTGAPGERGFRSLGWWAKGGSNPRDPPSTPNLALRLVPKGRYNRSPVRECRDRETESTESRQGRHTSSFASRDPLAAILTSSHVYSAARRQRIEIRNEDKTS